MCSAIKTPVLEASKAGYPNCHCEGRYHDGDANNPENLESVGRPAWNLKPLVTERSTSFCRYVGTQSTSAHNFNLLIVELDSVDKRGRCMWLLSLAWNSS